MKTQLRKNTIAVRMALTEYELQQKSAMIFSNLLSLKAFDTAATVMIYMDFRKEVQTKDMIEHCLRHQKQVVLPVVSPDKKNLLLIEIKSIEEDMALSSYGIFEPIVNPERLKTLKDIDLVLAPGVAFDLEGYRLGYGAGYYDQLLSNRPNRLTVYGLAFDLQVVPSVPHDAHDQRMDGIITESRVWMIK
jgi:5-formyltetrahydrofolate cyclo-ligase